MSLQGLANSIEGTIARKLVKRAFQRMESVRP